MDVIEQLMTDVVDGSALRPDSSPIHEGVGTIKRLEYTESALSERSRTRPRDLVSLAAPSPTLDRPSTRNTAAFQRAMETMRRLHPDEAEDKFPELWLSEGT